MQWPRSAHFFIMASICPFLHHGRDLLISSSWLRPAHFFIMASSCSFLHHGLDLLISSSWPRPAYFFIMSSTCSFLHYVLDLLIASSCPRPAHFFMNWSDEKLYSWWLFHRVLFSCYVLVYGQRFSDFNLPITSYHRYRYSNRCSHAQSCMVRILKTSVVNRDSSCKS